MIIGIARSICSVCVLLNVLPTTTMNSYTLDKIVVQRRDVHRLSAREQANLIWINMADACTLYIYLFIMKSYIYVQQCKMKNNKQKYL